ncbi:hypothetical protein BJ970_000382 [Saccharopolyspora phatthalungensis]|uniref:Uncharacterized protein n=1 Tax=Saccharopolyspora phatthalungensis TaxID=664693 RepID=A0A840Q249_9PSEU|nr:hypothetical protein [Saccharopolyspora phatthalungensis]
MSPQLDERLGRLQKKLGDHARIASHLGLDFERPIRSLGDGYPENAVSWLARSANGCSSSYGATTMWSATRGRSH